MIIDCINCNKKFEVNSDLIPDKGRTIQCGVCNHIWYFKKNKQDDIIRPDPEIKKNFNILKNKNKIKKNVPSYKGIKKDLSKKNYELTKYNEKQSFSFGKLLSIILVIIITFVALLIIIDTFKTPLYRFFPNLEFFLYNLFETLKDIELFIKDLI